LTAHDKPTTTSTTTTNKKSNEKSSKPDIYENESVEDEMKRFLNKACGVDTDCGMSNFLICSDDKICEHKSLFPI
jgi:hypothetical protein